MARRIVITPLERPPIEQQAVELCEHKGIGHPDTIVDGVCEAASRALSHAYLAAYGRILHHNLDKGLLVAGASRPCFGGGEMLEPMKLVICGRATSAGPEVNVRDVAAAAARDYLAHRVRCDLKYFEIATEIREGAGSLKEVLARGAVLANDTSFGCGFAPYSRLEEAVLRLARVLRSEEFRARFPAAGDDFKVMGSRVDGDLSFTVALAFIDRHVASLARYFALKEQIVAYLAAHLPPLAAVRLNTLDDPHARSEDGVYLTVTGLSAEMGDDGQAGRGNRVSGLITPGRLMSLEAAAGKNPVAHVGKLYNVLATLIAREVHETFDAVEEVGVQLLSNIGRPIDEPELAALEVRVKGGLTEGLKRRIAALVDERLAGIERVTPLILAEQVPLY